MDSQIKKKLLKLKDPEELKRCKDPRYFYNTYCKAPHESDLTEREFTILQGMYSHLNGRLRRLFCTMAKLANGTEPQD